MEVDLSTLRNAVQTNCHIADAHHAGDHTLCIYLLKMREYYRWEQGADFSATLPRQAVTVWLTERERLWEHLETHPYVSLPIKGDRFDPFATEDINRVLLPQGYVYSGGLSIGSKPHFFLARLEQCHAIADMRIIVAAEEYARDMNAPPAMALGKTIFLRRESLRRMLWEKLEEWRWQRLDNTLGRALACYDFDTDIEGSLDVMTSQELETLRWHEIGEVRAGERLGEDWHALLMALPRSKAEFMLRAVRDHLADCLSTLPALLAAPGSASLHFYFANLVGMRGQLFPSLIQAYQRGDGRNNREALTNIISQGVDHWASIATAALELYRERGEAGLPLLVGLIESKCL